MKIEEADCHNILNGKGEWGTNLVPRPFFSNTSNISGNSNNIGNNQGCNQAKNTGTGNNSPGPGGNTLSTPVQSNRKKRKLDSEICSNSRSNISENGNKKHDQEGIAATHVASLATVESNQPWSPGQSMGPQNEQYVRISSKTDTVLANKQDGFKIVNKNLSMNTISRHENRKLSQKKKITEYFQKQAHQIKVDPT